MVTGELSRHVIVPPNILDQPDFAPIRPSSISRLKKIEGEGLILKTSVDTVPLSYLERILGFNFRSDQEYPDVIDLPLLEIIVPEQINYYQEGLEEYGLFYRAMMEAYILELIADVQHTQKCNFTNIVHSYGTRLIREPGTQDYHIATIIERVEKQRENEEPLVGCTLAEVIQLYENIDVFEEMQEVMNRRNLPFEFDATDLSLDDMYRILSNLGFILPITDRSSFSSAQEVIAYFRLRSAAELVSEFSNLAKDIDNLKRIKKGREILSIIHRDIKPSNILLAGSRNWVLTDFGISLVCGQTLMSPDGILGSPKYIAPEQIVDRTEGCAQSDVYAMGGILIDILAGKEAYNVTDGDHGLSIVLKSKKGELIKTVEELTEILFRRLRISKEDAQGLAATLKMATALDPDVRFESCEELLTIVEVLLAPYV